MENLPSLLQKIESLKTGKNKCPLLIFDRMCEDRTTKFRNCVLPRCCLICNKVYEECEGICSKLK
jgi:hypothetical protein